MLGKWDKNKTILTILFVLTVLCASGAVTAAENSNYITDNNISSESSFSNLVNNNGSSPDQQNLSTSSLNSSSHFSESIISGNVIRCTNGSSFPGVTVTAKSPEGIEVARTTTDSDGFYKISFANTEKNFYVSASYPGHMTLTKFITVVASNDTSDPNFYGQLNFQLGPEPTLTINAPSSQLVNETFDFTITFDNAGDETGFGPTVQLILPPEIQFNSATFLGAPVSITNVGTFPVSGTLIDPLSGLTVTGTPGFQLYIFEYPLGSFTAGQPQATININALLLGNSTLGVPLNITGYPVFRFGANETGTNPIRGDESTAQVTPTVIKITKTSNAPERETATGRNYPITYTLTVDVANGQTITSIEVADLIPGNLQFLQVLDSAGGTVTQQPSLTTPGGLLQIIFSSITGIVGPDRIITYQVYAPEFDNNSQHVLDELTGSWAYANNTANVTGVYNETNVFSNSTYTLTLKPLAIQKGVTIESTPPSPKPTDILRYTTNFEVSDYFSMGNVIITDVMSDGQSFLTDPSHRPYVQLHLPSGDTPILYFNVTPNPNPQMYWIYNSTSGITTIVFNITQLLIDNGYTGILEGGNYTGTNYGATRGTLTYWSQIKIDFLEPINHQIVSNDRIDNTVTVDANLEDSGHGVSDGSNNGVVIVAPSSFKGIYKINGEDPIGPPYIIRPGDTVTFSIGVNVPTTNLENFILIDYLPIPFLRATEFVDLNPIPKDQYDTPPPAGRWKLAWDDTLTTLSGVTPSLVIDPTQNILKFIYGEIHNSTQPQSLAHIFFTVTATGDPMADGLYLTNLFNIIYDNNFDESFSDNTIVSIVTGQPALTINKTATPTTNLQAGNEVTYTILISNTGHAPAYNVIVNDDLLTSNPSYIASISNIIASYVNGPVITGLNLMDLFTTGGLNFAALYPIFSVDDANNTINITYTVLLNDTVYPRQVINNTVNLTKYTSLPLPESPNFVRDPISSSASVQIRDVNFTKTYISSEDGISSTPNLTIGESGRFRLAITLPAGQITDLIITDIMPAGLSYVSYALDLTNYHGTLVPITFNQVGNTLSFLFTGTINTTANSTFFIDLILRANENTPYPGSTNVTAQNTATMNWNNPGHSPINSDASVNIVQPRLVVTKTFTPSIVQGGQVVTVRIRVTNNGHATAQHVIITDPLNNAGNIFDLGSVVSYDQHGFTFTYPSNTVTFSWGYINPGQTLDFYFNVTTLDTPFIGPSYINTANATYWSLPWNGTSPDDNSREYFNTGSDTLRTGDPTVIKSVVNSSIHGTSGNLTIGEVVTYRLQVYLPQGLMTNLRITDILPFGFAYVPNSYNVYSAGFSGTLGTLLAPQVFGQNVIFTFSGLTNSTQTNNPFYIELNATVLNSIDNGEGDTKQNDMSLTWDENTHGPFTDVSYVQIVEPSIAITKAATPTVVDGGDQVSITLTIRNNGSSNAYQINITDILNTTLFDPTTWSYDYASGYTLTRNGNIISIIGNTNTFLRPGYSQSFTFRVNVANDVPSDSAFTNIASVVYSSMPPGFNQNRTYTHTSNVVVFNTPPPSISKAIESTSEADSTGNNVLIGEVVTYRLNLTIPEGKTLNAIITDILPSNLIYNPGTAQIMRNNAAITATGFTFTQPAGIYESFPDASLLPLLTFNLGDISFTGANGLNNGIISIRFNVTVLNIAANQNGVRIPNSGALNFTNAAGVSRSLSAVAPDLTVRVPQLQIDKQPYPNITIAQGGDVLTFFIRVSNSNYYAPAYNLQILDFLNSDYYYNFYVSSIIPSTAASVIYHDFSTSNLLNITIDRLNYGDWLHIYYRVTVRSNVTYNVQINNTVHVTGTSLPGDHGTNNATPGNPGDTDGKRTGDPTQPAGAVNNINDTSTAIITIRSPRISKNVNGSKIVTRSIGETATEYIRINLPIGTTTELRIIDVLPEGLQATGFGFTATHGISVNQFILTPLGGNIYEINFGNIIVTQEGNLTLYYTVLVLDIPGNQNGVNLVNNATVYYLNSTGGSVNAGSDIATVQVVEPNLQIIKTPSKTNLAVGEEFTYTLLVTHTQSSTSDAHNLIITDTIPTGLTFVPGSQVCPGWTFTQNGNLLTFTRSILTLAEISSTILFNCIVDNDHTLAGQDITNYATVNYTSTTSGGREYTTSNSTQIHILGADLEVQKEGDSQVNAGEQVTYTITVTNNGPDTAINAVLTDNILAPWFNRLINPQYSLNSGGTWANIVSNPFNISLGDILSGATVNIIIRATVNASAPIGTINNTVHVTSSTTDPNPNNNNDTKLTDVDTLADLGVTKTGPSTVTAGNGITYTVVVTNYGPSDSQDVYLADLLPGWIYNVTYGAVSSSFAGHNVPVGTVWSSPLYWATVYAN
ncbi:MAG: carboxypeptidase regulatory-like domain-containing protein, partial [Methanobacterium sp.]|nr:carboxypeptidase regulatory-like domain-containing protein [Methanobacterium sp.]